MSSIAALLQQETLSRHQDLLIGGFVRHKWMVKILPEVQLLFAKHYMAVSKNQLVLGIIEMLHFDNFGYDWIWIPLPSHSLAIPYSHSPFLEKLIF